MCNTLYTRNYKQPLFSNKWERNNIKDVLFVLHTPTETVQAISWENFKTKRLREKKVKSWLAIKQNSKHSWTGVWDTVRTCIEHIIQAWSTLMQLILSPIVINLLSTAVQILAIFHD